MLRKANNVLELVGQTPIVRLNRLNPHPQVEIYVKLEYFNPGGSVKDRIALAMIEDAEKKGLLKKGYTIIEPTSEKRPPVSAVPPMTTAKIASSSRNNPALLASAP